MKTIVRFTFAGDHLAVRRAKLLKNGNLERMPQPLAVFVNEAGRREACEDDESEAQACQFDLPHGLQIRQFERGVERSRKRLGAKRLDTDRFG